MDQEDDGSNAGIGNHFSASSGLFQHAKNKEYSRGRHTAQDCSGGLQIYNGHSKPSGWLIYIMRGFTVPKGVGDQLAWAILKRQSTWKKKNVSESEVDSKTLKVYPVQ